MGGRYPGKRQEFDRIAISGGRGEAITGREARETETTIPVVEEELKVGKREVRRGGVRIYAHIEEVPVEEEITLKDERVTMETRPVDRPAGPGTEPPSRVMEISETVEEPVVSKERVCGRQALRRAGLE